MKKVQAVHSLERKLLASKRQLEEQPPFNLEAHMVNLLFVVPGTVRSR